MFRTRIDMDFAWQTLVENSQHILRASRHPAPASLLVTWPRPVIADLPSMLSIACARYAPQMIFGRVHQDGPSRIRAIAMLVDERIEIGVVANQNMCISYMLACRPDLVPDATPMIDAMLAQPA
jgi:hypothetical protein